jgi:hypothetical protein
MHSDTWISHDHFQGSVVKNLGSSAKRVGKKPRLMGENPFLSRVFWVLFGAKNLA